RWLQGGHVGNWLERKQIRKRQVKQLRFHQYVLLQWMEVRPGQPRRLLRHDCCCHGRVLQDGIHCQRRQLPLEHNVVLQSGGQFVVAGDYQGLHLQQRFLGN
ncbi:hypothetical protein PMAYCL1PPCAC_28367, partial [Pristionchus mayeri]